jgi:hypothetical protein
MRCSQDFKPPRIYRPRQTQNAAGEFDAAVASYEAAPAVPRSPWAESSAAEMGSWAGVCITWSFGRA